MARKDLFSSLFFVFLSTYVCWQSLDFGFGKLSKPGPGFFSFLSGLGLGFLALLIFLKSRSAKDVRETGPSASILWKPLALTFGALVGYTLFVRTLGFTLTTFLFLGIMLRTVGKKTWVLSGALGLAIAFGAYVFFGLLLQSQLPRGPLGAFGF